MVDKMDMSAHVTRAELREELDRAFEQRLAAFATKADLEAWGERLYDKLHEANAALGVNLSKDLEEKLSKTLEERLSKTLEERLSKTLEEKLSKGLGEMKTALSAELAHLVKSLEETFIKQVSTFDDKYKELPGRVQRLEGAVFPGERSVGAVSPRKGRGSTRASKRR